MKKSVRNTNDTENNIFDRSQGIENTFHGWWGMPDFSHKEYAYSTASFEFETDEDLQDFIEKTNLEITEKTKATWYPDFPYGKDTDHRYFEEDKV